MMYEPDGSMVMMDETPCTVEQIAAARTTVEQYLCDDPDAKMTVLEALGMVSYERVIVVNANGRTRKVTT